MGLGSSLKKAVGKATRGSLAVATGGLSELARKKAKGPKKVKQGPQSFRIQGQDVEQVDYVEPKYTGYFPGRYPRPSVNQLSLTPEMQALIDKYKTEVY